MTTDNDRSSNEYEIFMQEYRRKHSYCPVCGSKNLNRTLMCYIVNNPDKYIDRNACHCVVCGWSGIVHDLVEDNTRL